MTLQIPDNFFYREARCDVTAFTGPGQVFDPREYGFNPLSTSTASHRGFRNTYGLTRGLLCLKDLDINLFTEKGENPWEPLAGKPLNGIKPITGDESTLFNNRYRDINLEIDYTGAITIATEFINSLYEHMGFAPTWKYEEVYQLTFEKGALIAEKDISGRNSKLREKILAGKEDDTDILLPPEPPQ